MLIKAKITPHSIILVWHNSAMDLELLRELLDTAGYPNILPGKKNCITLIQQFRLGLPLNFSAALDVIFPVLFAGDALVGTNHRAMPDVKMTRKMVQLLFELQKPLSARILSDFRPPPKTSFKKAKLPALSCKNGSESALLLHQTVW